MRTVDPYLSIGIFIDGGYLAKINQALGEQLGMSIHMAGLFQYVRCKIAELYSFDADDGQIVESHYFRGRFRAEKSSTSRFLKEEVCCHLELNDLVTGDRKLLNEICTIRRT